MAQLGFKANFKVGFVLGSWFLIRYIWLTKSPTDAKPRDVVRHWLETAEKEKYKLKILIKTKRNDKRKNTYRRKVIAYYDN